MHIVYVLIKYYLNSKITFLDWPLFNSIISDSLYPRFLRNGRQIHNRVNQNYATIDLKGKQHLIFL